jgi:hypothetical protein
MKLRELMEEWFKTVKNIEGDTYEIFVNPTQKDIKDLNKAGIGYVRFLIDLHDKKVYIWDGDELHQDVSRKIKKPYRLKGTKGYAWGSGYLVKGSKIRFSNYSTDRLFYGDAKEIKNTDWLSKYFIDL